MHSATAFGLDLEVERPLPFFAGARATPCGRALRVRVVAAGAAATAGAGAELISDERGPAGEVVFQIERGPAGYRFTGPRYGETLLSADGAEVVGAPGGGGLPEWQRLLIAQVLPFAAVLRGLEAFHASGVVLDGEAVAIVGASGAGKTSLALQLASRGAGFLADDVLAVERRGEGLLVHPGAPVAGVATAEARRLRRAGGSAEPLFENEREEIVAVEPVTAPAPLGALLAVERRSEGPPSPRFEPLEDPRLLLGSTFNLLLLGPQRLEALLDICSRAAQGRVERLVVGLTTDPEELAEAVLERIGVAA